MKISNLYIKLASIFIVLICMFVVVLILQMSAKGILQFKAPRPVPAVSRTDATETERKIALAEKRFTPDGRLLLIVEDCIANTKDTYRRIYDVDYNLLWEGNAKQWPAEYLTVVQDRKTISVNKNLEESTKCLTSDMKRDIAIYNGSEDGPGEYWRYNDDGYFEGFLDGSSIGYAGMNGFAQKMDDIKPFKQFNFLSAYTDKSEYPAPILLCVCSGDLYLVDVRNRQVKPLYEDVADSLIYLNNWFKDSEDRDIGEILILRREQKPVVIFRKNFEAVEVSGIDMDPQMMDLFIASTSKFEPTDKYKTYIVSVCLEGFPGIYASREARNRWAKIYATSKSTETYRLYGLTDDGDAELINEETVVAVSNRRTISNEAQIDSYYDQIGHVFDLSPIAINYLTKNELATKIKLKSKTAKVLFEVINLVRPVHESAAWISGFVCALIVFVHNKNRTSNKIALVGWMAFAIFFNVAGLLTCLALTHYNLIKCEVCGKKRHLLRESCMHCGKLMPVSAPQATDIIC